jgi:F-box/leucine-rich repeat protein 10/11
MVDTGLRMYQDHALSQHHQDDNEAKRLSDAQLLLDFHLAATALQPPPHPPIPTAEAWNTVPPEPTSPYVTHTIAETSAEHADISYPTHARLDHAPQINDYNNPSFSDPPPEFSPTQNGTAPAVQTHTPPEDSLGAAILPPEEELPNGEDKKTRKQQGSQKWKTRAPRPGGTAARKKKATPRSKPVQSVIPPDQLYSPQSLPAESLDFSQVEEAHQIPSVAQTDHAFTTHARRHSYTNIHAPQIQDSQPYPALLRAQSVPLEPTMSVPFPAFTQRQSSKAVTKELEPATICAGCHSSDSATSIGDGEQWISCDGCKEWFHYSCAGFKSEREVREIDKFYCDACRPKFGATTSKLTVHTICSHADLFLEVRKSTRAHTAVDYAGLNEGILKTSDDNPEHHYIQAFKTGGLEFTPDTFARLPPECATADFIDKMNGFKEPLVIPAALNPRPKASTAGLSGHISKPADHLESSDIPDDQFGYEMTPDDGQDKLDMVIPEGLTVRRVAELYGLSETVPVIDVKAQEGEDKRWTMAKWADYYEQAGEKPVRNVISLEVSRSKLGRLIRRPKVVRDMDLQDTVWPEDEKSRAPPVQFYCLMSVADCYTDFHIDFGGSSVYYHIVKGKKTFFFIPPTKQNLKKYEDWCLSPTQGHEFLGKQVKDCYRVDLSPGDTMLIPSGWIHAVWTPEDSLVIGGNYLTRIHYGTQIKVVEIEKNTKVAPKFRYPFFQKIMWLTLIKYLEEDPLPPSVEELLLSGGQFERSVPIYCETDDFGHNSKLGLENYNRRYYPKGEVEGLPDLVNFIWRTVMISQGKVEGITQTSRNAVTRSIPKSHGDPSILARRFAMWVAWKRGNESIRSWAQMDSPTPETEDLNGDKTLPLTQAKGVERETWADALKLVRGGERHSSLRARASEPSAEGQAVPALPITGFLRPSREHITTPKTSQLGPKRIACDACRKRRIRCKHKDDLIETSKSGGGGGPSNGVIMTPVSPPASLGILAARRKGDIDIASAPLPPPLSDYDIEGNINGGPVSTELNTDALAQGRSGRMKACADCRKSKVGFRDLHRTSGWLIPAASLYT